MLTPGTIIGERYRLEEPIGQGGMATVWKAVHTTLDRPVALKFLEAIGTHAKELAARFLQEAKIAGGIRHRHVVDIQDFGVLDGGQPYMVMEYLEGSSLAERYTDGPDVTDWEVLEICAMTLSGLGAVHDAGILHRDIKPENIFLVEDADGVYPKLIDFGVSRGLGGASRLTKTGAVVGTPQYMSPEQARGIRDIDHRSDIFSMGILLYEGFAGQVPFDSENPGDILIRVATEEPVSLKALRPDLPEPVIALVHKALVKNREDRFQDARDMRAGLHAILELAEGIEGRPESTGVRMTYKSSPGSGKLRVLSRPPPAMAPAMPPPAGVGRVRTPSQMELAAPGIPAEAVAILESQQLPPWVAEEKPVEKPKGRAKWILPALIAAVVAVGGATFFFFDGWGEMTRRGWIPQAEGERDPGAVGELRPGEVVAIGDIADDTVELEPPPTEGEPAPNAETVDISSPPDPPEEVPASELDSLLVDTGPGASPAAPTRRPRRRPRRRRPR